MSTFISFLLVFVGGGLGASLRYAITLIPVPEGTLGGFPILTMVINFLGSFVIGVVAALASHHLVDKNLVTLIKVGFLGGFTTFSSFALDSITLFREQKYLVGGLYVLLSVGCCLLGCFCGELLVEGITRKE